MSIISEMRSKMPDGQDPVEWILAARKLIQSRDREFYEKLLAEIHEKIGKKGIEESYEKLKKKDAASHTPNYMGIVNATMALGPRLLNAPTLEDAVGQYFRYHAHTESCWRQACDCFREERYPFSAFFSILTLEETGKLSFLWHELLAFQTRGIGTDNTQRRKDPLYHHTKKHVLAACQGASVNSRLDRLVGLDRVKGVIDDAASGALEKVRQRCLYCDFGPEGPSIPSEKLDRDTALSLAVISGEVMADVLGNFPWEWERMMESVKEFEQELGFPVDE